MENKKKKVLVIDDNTDLNTVLVDKLNLSGFDASGASDGEDGLHKALSTHPDIVLLDLIMPKMDGMTMLKLLRDDEWGKTCKVVVLTLIEESEYIAKALELGAFGYIVKTKFTLDQMVEQVKLTLSRV